MDFVSIVTPNHMHFGPAMLALENGFHVMLDKPMTIYPGRSQTTGPKSEKKRDWYLG